MANYDFDFHAWPIDFSWKESTTRQVIRRDKTCLDLHVFNELVLNGS